MTRIPDSTPKTMGLVRAGVLLAVAAAGCGSAAPAGAATTAVVTGRFEVEGAPSRLPR